MPLLKPRKNSTPETVKKIRSYNIAEMRRSGRPVDQAVAAAYDIENKALHKKRKKS